MIDDNTQQLSLQTGSRNSIVDNRYQRRRIWRNLNERISRKLVYSEVFVIVDCLFSNLHHASGTLSEEVFSENWEKDWFDLVDFLDDEDFSESDCEFEESREFRVVLVKNVEVFLGGEVAFEPFAGLDVRVDE